MSDAGGVPALEVFDAAPVGVAAVSGPGHRLRYANDAFRRLTGEHPAADPALRAFPGFLRDDYGTLLDRVRRTGQPVTLRTDPPEAPESGRQYAVTMSPVTAAALEDGVLVVVTELAADPPADSATEERRAHLQRHHGLLQLDLAQYIWATGPPGPLGDPAPQRLFGRRWDVWDGLDGDAWLRTIHPDDRATVEDVWARARRDRTTVDHVHRMRTRTGGYRHMRTRAVPVVRDGRLVEWLGACVDVEQEWQEARRRELLDLAATATADLAGLDEVLHALTRVIVPALSDGCAVYLLPEPEDGGLPDPFCADRIINTNRDGLPSPPELRTERFDADSGFVEAVRTRRPVHRTFPYGSLPPRAAPPGAEEWFQAARANSMALIPILVDGTVAAVLDAVVCGDREPLSPADVDLLGRIFAHAHAHLSNALRFQHAQRVALALQHYLLPDPPDVPGLQIAVRYRPSATTAEIGGDWYDSFRLPGGATVLTVGDVAGHDLAAAVTMSQLRNMLRGLAMDRDEPPGDILRRLDTATQALYHESTATCVLARLERRTGGRWRLHYSIAGHPPPLLITPEGSTRFLDHHPDPLLGIAYDRPRTSARALLPPGSTLLLYTDGLVEVPGENLESGLRRLRHTAAALARSPVETLCDALLTRMPIARKDDIALIAARIPGDPAAPSRT